MTRQYLIVDDHPIVHQAMGDALRALDPECAVVTAERLDHAMRALRDGAPYTLVLFDLKLPDASGVDGLVEIRRQYPGSPVAVFSAHVEQPTIVRCLELGACGYIPKTHSPDAIRSVCQTGLFLDRGQARFFGSAERATDQYLAFVREHTNQEVLRTQDTLSGVVPFQAHVPGQTRYGTGHAQIESVQVLNARGEPARAFTLGEPITIEAVLRAHVDLTDLSVSFLVRDFTGVDLMGTTTFDERVPAPPLPKGSRARVRFMFENHLRPGNFGISLAVNRLKSRDYSDNLLFDQVDGVAAFVVMANPSRPVHYKFHQPVHVAWEPIA